LDNASARAAGDEYRPGARGEVDPELNKANIRLVKHEAIEDCGSYEVRFPDSRPSRYFYWDDVPNRRLSPDPVDSEQALEKTKVFVRAERDRSEGFPTAPLVPSLDAKR
jgi:hypothetical protein